MLKNRRHMNLGLKNHLLQKLRITNPRIEAWTRNHTSQNLWYMNKRIIEASV